MLPLTVGSDRPLRVLAVGAHCDDIEIGAGGTLLTLAQRSCQVQAVVLSGDEDRAAETRAALTAFCSSAEALQVQCHDIPDGRFPGHWDRVKQLLHDATADWTPDLVLCPSRTDAHQDHRLLAELIPTVLRDTLVWQYEIPKWDGDLGRPSVYVPLSEQTLQRKVDLLFEHFGSQHGRDWFDREVFGGLARLRGMECRAPYAEAFGNDKLVVALS